GAMPHPVRPTDKRPFRGSGLDSVQERIGGGKGYILNIDSCQSLSEPCSGCEPGSGPGFSVAHETLRDGRNTGWLDSIGVECARTRLVANRCHIPDWSVRVTLAVAGNLVANYHG